MFDPFDAEEDKPPRPPFPTPTGALLLTFGASFASLVVALLFFEEIDVLALGVGEAFGVGGVATLAARRVPDPQPERLGLRGFSPRLLPILLCLVPLVFVISELDNQGRHLDEALPPLGIEDALVDRTPTAVEPDEPAGAVEPDASPDAASDDAAGSSESDAFHEGRAGSSDDAASERDDALGASGSGDVAPGTSAVVDPPEGWALIQIAIVTLGISPVVEGFLFFGVILQGLITWLGRNRGLILTGCLYALIHAFGQAGADAGLVQSLVAIASFIGMGVVLGICRLSTGSVLAPILVDTGFKGVALLAMASPELLAVPGYNVDLDAHTPLTVLVPAALMVAWGLFVLTRQERAMTA